MARIVFRPSLLPIRRLGVKWVIIHDTYELYDRPEVEIDSPRYQFHFIYKQVLQQKGVDINYHYIVEKVGEEYIAIATRPLLYLCNWPDINENINKRAIHVALLGSYEYKVPESRLYQVAAYRVIAPILKMYGLPQTRVKTHSQVTTDPSVKCPGEFFNIEVLISNIRKFWIR